MKSTTNDHLGWVDLLRVIACFLVILSHSCDPFVGKFDAAPGEFLSGAMVGSLVRCCVPLFIMISGLLLLPVNMSMSSFYTKRTKRLLVPFVFWSLMLPVLYFLYINSGFEIVNPNIVFEDYTLSATIRKMYLFIFNFNYDTTPLWYAYMLVGLYLFMPVIGAWLKQATQKEIKIFLYIWVVSMCLPYVEMAAPLFGYTGNYGSMGILGVCFWNPYGTFYYFSGFLGYAVLAYYLNKYPLNWSMRRTLSIAVPMFLIGYAITAGGFILTQKYFPASYANLEIIWYFSGINVSLMTISVFIIVQRMKAFKASPLLRKVSALTFGIYLFHFVVVQFAYDLIYPRITVAPVLQILLIALLSFALSAIVIWLMSLNKVTNKLIS